MAGKPVETVAYAWKYHCGSMEFPGIAIDAEMEATAQ